jgi:serine/threonine protein kinase/Tol biopolymer transport system component
MNLTAGARLGPYEIVAPLGAGGMGDVYRAKDTRLDRVVAVKVLSSHVAADPQLRQRFEREARAISSLNHPNICALFDVGEANIPEPIPFLVMELVEGESLSERLTKGPLSLDESLQRGIEIADALSSAHRRGIIHRDVKPGNVMLTKAGAKLLDFGLAKSGSAVSALQGGTAVTTATPPDLTAHGTIVGTFQYMAPEQLEGLDVDARTDIFAFGALLFEMITGRKAFAARTQASLIGAILRDQPPMVSSVIAVTPAALDRVITKCLAKDPDQRWQDASDLRDELKWIAEGGSRVGGPTPSAARRRPREWLAWALFATALGGIAALSTPYLRRTPPPSVVRFTLSPPQGVAFAPRGAPVAPFPAVSPDGTRLVFVAHRDSDAAPSLWLQSFDSLDARQLNDTTVRTDTLSPGLPFWSPDSRSVGFFADGKLKRIEVDGGSPQTICDAPESGGASWGANGTIVFASKIDEGLRKVAANGGVPVQITTPDAARGEISHSNPAFLPDGRHFLFWVQAPKSSIRVGSIDSTETKPLFESDSRAVYASGYVFFVRQSTLFAQPFDTARLDTSGEPVPISDEVRTFPLNGRSAFSASANGVLVYRSGAVAAGRALAWYDRTGKQIAIVPDSTAMYSGMSLHPDDRHLVAQIDFGSGSDLWMIDLEQGTRSRITSDSKSEGSPVLSPDGRLVAFASDRNGVDDLFRKRADGVGDEQVLLTSTVRKYPTDWSRRWISFTVFDSIRKLDLWMLEPDREARPYLQTEFSEQGGRLSPDERWMLYTSDEAGRNAIYLRPFPNANGGKWRVSGASVGIAPRWRADGTEIFYVDEIGRIIAVPVELGDDSPEFGVPQVLFQTGGLGRAQYEVRRDGTRFLVPVRTESRQGDVPLSVVLNWPTLFVRK